MSGRLNGPRWDWLEHPLVGIRRRESAVAAGYCLLVVAATVLAALLYAGAVDLLPGAMVRVVDGFTAVWVFVAVLSATVLPALYGLRNGGPAMAVAVGLVPYLAGMPLFLDYTLTNDLVLALVGAAFGAVVAVAVTWRRHTREAETMAPGATVVDGLLLASAVSAVAGVAVYRFDSEAPAHMVATVDPLHWLVAVPLLGCVVLWAVAVGVEGGPASAYSDSR